MIFYKTLCNLELIADNPSLGLKSKKIILYKGEPFSVVHKQKDLFDSDVEYWMNLYGWIIKINKNDLTNIVENQIS
jgi:hypothetical protein